MGTPFRGGSGDVAREEDDVVRGEGGRGHGNLDEVFGFNVPPSWVDVFVLGDKMRVAV